uniref:Uncharacterized protein n=1 Tax=Moniliophthora roreri TaxID=221103 RepID=A0A0W0GE61_MONRR
MKVIVGKAQSENSSGDSKTKIFQGIRAVMWPEYHQINSKKTGEHVKSWWEDLHSTYKEHATRNMLHTSIRLEKFYIPPEGPDHNTPVEAKNIWNQIVGNFKFFPHLHHILSTQANITPPTVTTASLMNLLTLFFETSLRLPQYLLLHLLPLLNPKMHFLLPCQLQHLLLLVKHLLHHYHQPCSLELSLSSGLSNSQIASLAAVPYIPKKHGFDELLGDIYQKHIATAEREAATDAKEKDCAHYCSKKATALRLFEAGIYTPRTTKCKICSIDRRLKKYESSPLPPSSPSRARSPHWDIKDSEGEQ